MRVYWPLPGSLKYRGIYLDICISIDISISFSPIPTDLTSTTQLVNSPVTTTQLVYSPVTATQLVYCPITTEIPESHTGLLPSIC